MKFTKLDSRASAPECGTPYAAGADLRAVSDEPITIRPNETVLVHTGLAMEIPEGLVGLVYARSGLASKRGLAPANCVGVIDSDYRGEIMVALHNHSAETQTIESALDVRAFEAPVHKIFRLPHYRRSGTTETIVQVSSSIEVVGIAKLRK